MIFGHPYHGLVRDGHLTLPNGQTIAYPQPKGGDCSIFRVPGTPPVSRTADEAAFDMAHGHQWLDYALISGSDRRLYGKPLGPFSWIYSEGPGQSWIITPLVSASGTLLTISLTVRPFGRLGVTGSPSTVTASVPSSSIGALSLICDHTPDGSRAILRLNDPSYGGTRAFIEVTVGAEATTAGLSVLSESSESNGNLTVVSDSMAFRILASATASFDLSVMMICRGVAVKPICTASGLRLRISDHLPHAER